jgi:hypothetical protein
MTPLSTDMKIQLAAQRGDMREALGWNFVKRLEKLVDELLGKIDCPDKFWVIYTAKWDYVNKKIKEMWQVTDAAPACQQLGQIVYEVHKEGWADFIALPFDVPVPDEEYSDEIVKEKNKQYCPF